MTPSTCMLWKSSSLASWSLSLPGFGSLWLAHLDKPWLVSICLCQLAEASQVSLGSAGFAQLDLDTCKGLSRSGLNAVNKIAAVLEIQFVKHEHAQAPYVPLEIVTVKDIEPGELEPGGVAHEMGSLPMPNQSNDGGVLDSNLQMKYGWYTLDAGQTFFPYSPAANPTLSLAALSLRLSDHLIPPKETLYQPIIVYNLRPKDVCQWVLRSMSHASKPSSSPSGKLVKIESGKSEFYASENSRSYDVQLVKPGVNTLIIEAPPTD
ncbi:hypothetical protein GGX14DRAFT_387352 [Mycena pura]|uniref:Uncharacterized protein n=1 Tax=Mycena pura TaxID=153505 RepID=A0AAD6YNQ1_9AGAR|nr:hypothetical protein GGX14DRAFT_387352 [Mycena pura]